MTSQISAAATVASIFEDTSVARDLFERVDQTWEVVAEGSPPTAEAARQYVLAVSAVSEAALDSLQAHEDIELDAVVSAASLAPVVERTQRPWHAVVGVALATASIFADRPDIMSAALELRSPVIDKIRYVVQAKTTSDYAAIAIAVSDALTKYEMPLATVQRVFEPRSDDELGTWLGVSRTTVSDWRTTRSSPRVEHERRLETVANIARLVDRYIHPEDHQLYLRQTTLPAFDDRTLATVLATKGPDAQQTLNRALELIRAGLVQ